MRFLIVPPDIALRDLLTRQETGQKYAFWTWIQDIVLMDARFGVSWKTGRTANKIADALFQKPAGTVVELEDADLDLLKEAAEEPQRFHRASGQVLRGYEQPALLQQVGPYIEAVQAAATRTERPKPPKPAPELAPNGHAPAEAQAAS